MNPEKTLKPKKSLGQHFLHSPSALKKIVDAAHIAPGETVLEIGPGTGVLTKALLETGAKVVAIEKDNRAFDVLSNKFAPEIVNEKLELVIGDVLEENFSSTSNLSTKLREGKYALVANIPYYITGAILEKFLEYSPRPNRMVLLVQKEVAERIVARDKKESILSISVKAFGTPRVIAIVPRGAFVPAPNVDSAILEINDISGKNFTAITKKNQNNVEIARFFEIVKVGFAHKRKFVKRNLESVLDQKTLEQIWTEQNIPEKIRAEDMSLEQFIYLSRGIK